MDREWTQAEIDAEMLGHDDGMCSDCDEPIEQCGCTFLAFQCGMMANGQCTKAGSEECDWDCPRNRR
jgi:hypothetical protein